MASLFQIELGITALFVVILLALFKMTLPHVLILLLGIALILMLLLVCAEETEWDDEAEWDDEVERDDEAEWDEYWVFGVEIVI
jgi:hypothetical protein